MFTPQPLLPVKLFVAILWADRDSLQQATAAMIGHWGPIDFIGSDHAFDATNYYDAEMGSGLQRRLVSFETLVSPEILAEAKLQCNQIELDLSTEGRRRVNLDIGYLDHNKLVLASLKPAGQKIYLTCGIYADLVARYRAGRYCPFEWTFPDFRGGRYDLELAHLRQQLLQQRRSGKETAGGGGA
jgi:hypothetical protein